MSVPSQVSEPTGAPTLGRDLGPVGRLVRVVAGLAAIGLGILLAAEDGLSALEVAVTGGYLVLIAVFYLAVTALLGPRMLGRISPWTATTLFLTPAVVLAALPGVPASLRAAIVLYYGVSLLLIAAIRYGGCEVVGDPDGGTAAPGCRVLPAERGRRGGAAARTPGLRLPPRQASLDHHRHPNSCTQRSQAGFDLLRRRIRRVPQASVAVRDLPCNAAYAAAQAGDRPLRATLDRYSHEMIAGVIVPGRRYGPQAPLLDLASEALADRNAPVETISWTVPKGLLDIGPEPFVRAHVVAALHRLTEAAPAAQPVIIAKSLGTYAAMLAAERELPAIWLTPLLHIEPIAEAITRNPASALLVGGTRDRSWIPKVADATGKDVLVIVDGDHGLRPPGPLQAYTDALGTIGSAMEVFLTMELP